MDTQKECANCRRSNQSRMIAGLCKTCYEHRRIYGEDRKVRLSPSQRSCIHCGIIGIEGFERCPLCYNYHRKHGVDRPDILLIRQTIDKKTQKVCRVCKRILDVTSFYKDRRSRYQADCKDCQRNNSKAWNDAHPEYRREYLQRTKTKQLFRDAKHRRRARFSAAFVERVDVAAIYQRDKGKCQLCGQPVEMRTASLDHILPISLGGAHQSANVQLVHRNCNARKGNRPTLKGEQLRLIG